MATPFPFTAGQVLTAAQLNAITELVINDKTDSYTLVAGDAGEYVVMNKATSSTITVPNSVFTAGQIVRIVNKGAGVCTVTAGAGTTVSSTGTLALAQYATGTLIAISASAFIFEAGGVTASAGGLVYITGASFSAVSSVSLPANTFSSTYRNYKISFVLTDASADNAALTMRLRAAGSDDTTSNYYSITTGVSFGGTTQYNTNTNGGTSFGMNLTRGTFTNDYGSFVFDILDPKQSVVTQYVGSNIGKVSSGLTGAAFIGGAFDGTTSFDSLSIIVASGTITGYYRIYGYADS